MRFSEKKQFEIFNRKDKKGFLAHRSFFPDLKTGLVVLVVVCFFLLNFSPLSRKIRSFFYFASKPVQEWLWEKGGGTFDFFEWVFKMRDLEQENEGLWLETQDLTAKKIELLELKKENEVLRQALGLGLSEEFELIISEVIAKETSKDYLIVNKGSRDGIAFGFPVITEQKVLIGKVIEVQEAISKIQLISAKGSSFDVQVFERETYGLAKGDGNFKVLINLIEREEKIEVGDKIITAVFGGNFPKGLLVGEIIKVKKSDVSSFQEAELNPALNIQELDYLFIISNFNL